MDNLDERILKVLRDDSRFTPAQIAPLVGIDEKDAARRIKAMEASGVIAKYTALCNTEKLSEDVVTALIEDRKSVV